MGEESPSVSKPSSEHASAHTSHMVNTPHEHTHHSESSHTHSEHTSHPHSKPKTDWFKLFWEKKWILLILIPIIVAIFIRTAPMGLVPLDRAAETNVMNYYRQQIDQAVSKQYPDLPDAQKQGIIEENLNQVPKDQLNEQIKTTAAQMKSRLQYNVGDKSYAYLGDIDSYYWLRQSRNILETGDQCDLRKDGVCYDTYTTAPVPRSKAIDYYPIVIVGVYQFLKIFQPDIPLMQASFLTPLVLSILLTIPLFLMIRRIAGNSAALIGTILVSASPLILSRSLGSDNDIANVFFQGLFLWLAVECFYASSAKKRYIWAALVGIELTLYSLFWPGWWYLFDLFALSLAFKFAFDVAHQYYTEKNFHGWKAKAKDFGLTAAAIFIPLAILFCLLFSFTDFVHVFTDQLSVLKFKVAANPNMWPNVLTTVAEFNPIGLSNVLSSFGSFYFVPVFLVALFGILSLMFPSREFIRKYLLYFGALIVFDILLFRYLGKDAGTFGVFMIIVPFFVALRLHLKESKEQDFKAGGVFLLACIITLVTFFSLKGVRFMFLMALPVAVLASVGFARVATAFTKYLGKKGVPKIALVVITGILIFWFVGVHVRSGYSTAQNYMPMVTDEWVGTLEKINAESKPDAIINSWWDFGHQFKYFADRGVTLDGSSQNSPQLHWLGKLLLTSDERLSVGILRMLDCGGNSAFDTLNKRLQDTPRSINILNAIMKLNRKEAASYLAKEGFGVQDADAVLKLSHCDAPENYLITSQDMVGKAGVWAHFGSWDFNKAYIQANLKKSDAELISNLTDEGISEQKARDWIREARQLNSDGEINTWIATWPSFYSGFQECSQQDNKTLCVFQQNNQAVPIVVDFKKLEATVTDASGKTLSPRVLFVGDEITLTGDASINLGMVVVNESGTVYAMFMASELPGSMFTRLFFFDGRGLDSFEKFEDVTSLYGDKIITWKVKWPE